MLVEIKGIHTVKRKLANGSTRTYYYAWRGGPRMKSKPHTEAFAREHGVREPRWLARRALPSAFREHGCLSVVARVVR